MTTSHPTASVVSRALRRDVKIITTPRTRAGYHVSGGYGAPSISVDVYDVEASNVRHAEELLQNLRDVFGWTVRRLSPDSSIIRVHAVPSAKDAKLAEARYDTKDRAETESRIAASDGIPNAVANNLDFLGGAR